ncbi:16397_t:CDS:2 [Gigaspora margarita]|uniref:16397_t:CDS:1 n=1 Tax=Gigaspora margarita TaxID=4874 RepID=A0ABN7WJS9_GIGMA|nr:16397_t:CDS:2 [Gigaspora margarita]
MNKIKKRKENSDTNIKKRVSLTGVQKKELCEKKCNNPNLKGVNLAKEYGISEQSVSDILKCSEHWLEWFNNQMRLAQQNIILLLDNASSHNSENIQDLSNIHIHFLPSNTTSCLQPIDQGIEAYDAITEDNPVPSDITLYDAINFVAQAWKMAGILLSMEILDDNFTSMHKETKSEASVSEKAELEAEIINLIERLPIDDPLDVQEYIEVDNYMIIEEDLTINEIIDIVNGQNESESEKEQEEMVKIGDAIVGLENLIKYIQQNDLEITSSLIKDLCSLKKYIIYLHNESKRQATLEEFINLTV